MRVADERSAGLRLSLCDARGRARLSPEGIEALLEALEAKPRHAWVTLEGSDSAFCEGLDLERVVAMRESAAVERVLQRYASLLRAIAAHPRPVLALVDGPALGGGLGVAAAADLVLATERARFALPEVLIGLVPGVVLPVLAARVGATRARSLGLGRAPLDGPAALRAGLVDEQVTDLEAARRRHCERFARMSPDAVAAIKQLATGSFESPEEYAGAAARSFAKLWSSRATQARLRRFLAGETPWPESDEEIDEERS